MEQPTFSDLEYQGKKRKTRRELFLERVEGRIQACYPKADGAAIPTRCLSCCASTASSSSTISATPAWKTPAFVGAGSALRVRPGPAVRGTEAHRPPARRDHHPQLPAPVGEAPPGAGSPGGNQRPPGTPGAEAAGGNHRGRHHHRGAVVHQEPEQGARPGDAFYQEGEPVAFRDEGPHPSASSGRWTRRQA